MDTILQNRAVLEPVLLHLPEKRLQEVGNWLCEGSLVDNRRL